MKRWNENVLIGFGLAMGFIVGGALSGGLFAPSQEKPWLEAYGGFLGAVATLVGASVVVWQIRTSAIQFERQSAEQAVERLQLWKQTDGNVVRAVERLEKELDIRRLDAMNITPHYMSVRDYSDIPAEGVVPISWLMPIDLDSTQAVTKRCTPAVEAAYLKYAEVVGLINNRSSAMRNQLFSKEGGVPTWQRKDVLNIFMLLQALSALKRKVYDAAELTKPGRA